LDKKIALFKLGKQLSEGKGKRVGETGYRKEIAHCRGYKWLSGPDKGIIISIDKAQKLMMGKDYSKQPHKLAPLWGVPFEVVEAMSVANSEIQSHLGDDVTIDEYGSFSNK
jgi:hypothetical protein